MTMQEQVKIYKDDLALFPDKDTKMEYILDYAKLAVDLDVECKTDENIIKGCSSLAWLQKDFKDEKILLEAEGDSLIAKGMLVLLLGIFNKRTPDEILSFDTKLLLEMGVMELLSPVRQQGMEAFLSVIYGYAQECKEA
ncbi:MAG: cysteine desulfuration protein SufE [Sulfurimonas sp.]|jgi:cysteine desulfuration protein SufE|uniref:SufE family protein n=1 Tax=Sulfurimonas sp. TaxID=2022749 RepID=UPI0039E2C8F1